MSDFENLGPRWYVIHTYSGYENKVKLSIEKVVEIRGLGHMIFDLQIPTETEIVKNEKGVEREVETKLFPAYVFIKMIMTDESWHIVRNITGVTGFVGPGSKPVPLTEEEIASFQIENASVEESRLKVGMKVKAISGTFAGYSGVLQEVSEDNKQLTVLISTERRDIPVILEAKDVVADE
ncbi:MAG: transcription termination/antitermination factor NusG [Clostridia bacterium]|nr:transcription termination/antitermination factor NusG [Clostridia bacterium]